MTKPVWSFWPRVLSQTMPDCIRYIIGVFCYNSHTNIINTLQINTLACAKADIAHAQEFTLFIHCAESLRWYNVYLFCL